MFSSLLLSASLALAAAPSLYQASFPLCASGAFNALSCPVKNSSAVGVDSCCQVSDIDNQSGGLFLSTHIWDTTSGLDEAFTLHGLWPDYCNGKYPAYCVPGGFNASKLENLTAIFKANEAQNLLYEMEQFWVSSSGGDASFWIHEWLKHGTCISTLKKSCYGSGYTEGEEVLDYFRAALKQYHRLPTYQWLEQSGIVPSSTTMYTYAQIQAAIKKNFGYEATLSCNKAGSLTEVWYNFNVFGTAQDGAYIPVAPPSNYTSCSINGTIAYLPKISGYKHSPNGPQFSNITYFP